MSQNDEIQKFADSLRGLKNRSGRSYEALARRTGVSSSSLHRYCAGAKIPSNYVVVQHFAQTCGADRHELTELRHLWTVAAMARTEQAGAGKSTEPPLPPRRPLSRRRLALAIALVALSVIGAGVVWLSPDRGRATAVLRRR